MQNQRQALLDPMFTMFTDAYMRQQASIYLRYRFQQQFYWRSVPLQQIKNSNDISTLNWRNSALIQVISMRHLVSLRTLLIEIYDALWCHKVRIPSFYTLRSKQDGGHFCRRHFQMHFFGWKSRISIKISLRFVSKDPIHNISASDEGLASFRLQAIIWTNGG